MVSKLIVAEQFAATLAELAAHPRQSILLHGVKGVGLATIALELAGSSAMVIRPLDKKGEYDEQSGSISVERIRQLYEETRSSAHAFVVIDDADRMTVAAQNAFLKLLEEPSSALHFILTSHHPEKLLQTILSRTSRYHVPMIDDLASKSILTQARLASDMWPRALFLASGKPAELLRLTADPSRLEHQAAIMSDARTLLSGSTRYERLVVVLRYASNRSTALELIDAALAIIKATLYTSPSQSSASVAEHLLTLRTAIADNSSPRLQLTHFVLQ